MVDVMNSSDKYRVIFIDTSDEKSWIKEYSFNDVIGPIELGVKLHLFEYETWKKPAYDPLNALVIGTGLFTNSKLYGFHRFTFVFKSPITRGLHVASMGGAAYQFRVNAHAIVLIGRSDSPVILKIFDEGDGKPVVEFNKIDERDLLSIWREYGGLKGIYALQKYLLNTYGKFYSEYNARSLLVGPASKFTSIGAIASLNIVNGEIDWGSEDFAARGGPGSVMYKAHSVVAIIYGGRFDKGVYQPEIFKDTRLLNEFFQQVVGKPYINRVIEAGTKYRFDPKIGSGGTLGGNYPVLKIYTPMFNWNQIYLPIELREKLHSLIMDHIWKVFNEEAIETKSWKTCGEPCPLACKKVRLGKFKSDYEPYNGLGPMIGVFDIHEIQRVVELVDSYGLDAIETGNLIAFLMDALEKGLLKPEEIGVSHKPFFDPFNYRIEYSKHNADIAVQIVENISWGRNPILKLIGERGIRASAKILDTLYEDRVRLTGYRFVDLLVYASFGEEGSITPNFYWTPGMVAPLPVLGRYWTLYKGVFTEPEDFAKNSFERAIREMWIDNSGMCRFHREWAEAIYEKLYELRGVKDAEKRHVEIYRLIVKYQDLAGATPSYWDSRKIIDFLEKAANDYGNEQWASKFTLNRDKAAREWWTRFYNKLNELLSQK